jgi:hypothetical protein
MYLGGMDRSAAHDRLTKAGLDETKAAALTELLWNVHESGEIGEVDLAHLSDAGFRHVDVCVMRELLAAALSRRAGAGGEKAALRLLRAFGERETDH